MAIAWSHDLAALAQVVLIDVALAGDNAVVVGLAVAGLPEKSRRIAIALGIGAAAIIRIGFGLVAITLLELLGLTLAGGLLLLWVAWRMYRDLAWSRGGTAHRRAPPTFVGALLRIVLADVSMSLDNVLAVAGAAQDSRWVLAAGLVLSVALMAVAADLLARVIERHRWVAWLGLAMVVFVAVRMIWEGSHEVAAALP
jgi:YjbE family integral membrane protein